MIKRKLYVNVLGLGYIGLPTAALIASKGMYVTGVDINPAIVDLVNNGKVHIVEPDLEGLVYKVVQEGYLTASMQPTESDVYIIAVPTPLTNNNLPDISFVEKAIEMIIPYVREENMIIIESTCPIGTTEKMYEKIIRAKPNLKNKIYMAYCPERVLPGRILYELEYNSRIVGGIDKASAEKIKDFYKSFVKGDIYTTNSKVAEMCKLIENAYRDVNIAFANEVSMLAEDLGLNPWEVIELANKHPRVNILKPGVGVGGHCIPIDPWFLISIYPERTKLIKAAREVNMYKTQWVIEKIKKEIENFKRNFHKEPVIACLGLTYKENVDDIRESPSLYIVEKLMKEGFEILPVDPYVEQDRIGLRLYDLNEALNTADIVVILVPHSVFISKILDAKTVIDFTGVLYRRFHEGN